MKRMTAIWIGAAWVAVCVAGGPARGATLSLRGPEQPVPLGAEFGVDLVVSGLGEGAAPSLGAFEAQVAFPETSLQFVGYALGEALGLVPEDALDGSAGPIGGGVLDLAESSLLPEAALTALQPGSFALATLTFRGLEAGDAQVAVRPVGALLVDAGGGLGEVAADLGPPATIAVTPLPGAGWLLAGGLGAVAAWGRRRR
ncbi:MAG: hypothetical protein Kow0092_15810 [Deferrisomatales bacterium]